MSRASRFFLMALAALLAGAALRGAVALVEAALEGKLRERLVAEAAERGFSLSLERVKVRLPFRASVSGLSLTGRGVAVRLERADVRAGLFGPGGARATSPRRAGAAVGRAAAGDVAPGRPERLGRLGLARPPRSDEPGRARKHRVRTTRRRFPPPPSRPSRPEAPRVAPPGRRVGWRSRYRLGRRRPLSRVRRRYDPRGEPLLEKRPVRCTVRGRRARHLLAGRAVRRAGVRDGHALPRRTVRRRRVRVGNGRGPAWPGTWGRGVRAAGRLVRRRGLGPPPRARSASCGVGPRPSGGRSRPRKRRAGSARDGADARPEVVCRRAAARFPATDSAVARAREAPRPLSPRHDRARRKKSRRRGRSANPDFVPLDDVLPLFVRGLLTSEDASFWGHPGLDLAEMPVAMSINWVREEKSRGASTITQQLAKNLFLTRERSYRRKLQEAALALLLEPTLGKRRILEIYLNVIEWGPGIHGIGPRVASLLREEPVRADAARVRLSRGAHSRADQVPELLLERRPFAGLLEARERCPLPAPVRRPAHGGGARGRARGPAPPPVDAARHGGRGGAGWPDGSARGETVVGGRRRISDAGGRRVSCPIGQR